MAFDIEGARRAGYSDAEIADYMAANQRKGKMQVSPVGAETGQPAGYAVRPDMPQEADPIVGPGATRLAGRQAAEGADIGTRVIGGAGSVLMDAGNRMQQLMQRGDLTPMQQNELETTQGIRQDPLAAAGAVGGTIGAFGYPAGAMQGALARGLTAALPGVVSGAAGPLATGLTGAALSGATVPVGEGNTETQNMLHGGAAAMLGDFAARTFSRLAQPIRQSPETARLLQEGIVPTPGQAAGPNSMLGRAEQRLQSVPVVGQVVSGGRTRAVEEFNRAAMNRAMPPGERATNIGPEGIAQARQATGAAYDRAYGNSRVNFDMDPQFMQDAVAAVQAPRIPLTVAGLQTYQDTVRHLFNDQLAALSQRAGGQTVAASEVKQAIESELGAAIRQFTGHNASVQDRSVGEALHSFRDAVRGVINRNISPDGQIALPALNLARANRVAVESAVERARGSGNGVGVFSPYQLQSTTARHPDLRALANDAQSVLGNTVPNSGTADRAMQAAMLGGGAGAYFGAPAYLTGLLASPLAYSRAGSRYMVGDLIPGQAAIGGLLSRGAPMAGVGSLPLRQLMQEPQP